MPPAPRILFADDDPIIVNLMSAMLQSKGYSIVGTIKNSDEAFVKTIDTAPSLVIMDLNLAGLMDAIDTAHYIFQLFHVPVVFLAGTSDEEKVTRITYALPCAILFKPFSAIELTATVDLALSISADRVRTLKSLPVGDPRKMMDNDNEAVIILDKRGRILLFSTYAEWFVDKPFKDAFMRHWRDVMMFMSDTDGEEIRDPVTAATKHMAGSIYDASTSVVTTTSKRRQVILAIRPIRDNHDRLIGALMSLKENKKTYM